VTIALLSIGTELTRGELVNSNASWLADQLVTLGHEVTEIVTVDDDDGRIVQTLLRLADVHTAVISTGGLGPTTDDLTTACAAHALGVELVRDARSLMRIEGLFAARNIAMQPSNAKQADFPAGALVLDNDLGTAPGFAIELSGCRAFFTPGVPSEMRAMFDGRIAALLPAPEAVVAVRKLRTYGMSESKVNDLLAGIEEEHAVTIGYRASHSEIEVKVLARRRSAETDEETAARAEQVKNLVRARLGDIVYSEGSTTLPAVLGQLLLKKRMSLALAESCTGGLVSELVTQVPGASAYYQGGVCSYSNGSKTALLGVPAALIDEHGAVSEPVALAMARGAQRAFGADVALAVTGIAGPSGGTSEKPIGLVHWAVAFGDSLVHESRVFSGDRSQIQRRAALSGLWSVRRALLG